MSEADAGPCAAASMDAFAASIGPGVVAELLAEGFVVLEGALEPAFGARLRDEVLALREMGLMDQNRVAFGGRNFDKPHIFEADLHDAVKRGACPLLGDVWAEGAGALCRRLNELCDDLALGETTDDVVVKLQLNEGSGGCFPWHYDNPGRPNRRRVTALFYLNPDWGEGDGGELLLLPFLAPVSSATRVAPRHGTVVLFLSDRVVHRVLPSRTPRVAFTLWLDGRGTNGDEDCLLRARHLALEAPWAAVEGEEAAFDPAGGQPPALPPAARHLRASPLQRQLSRAVYAEAYEASLRECMAPPQDGSGDGNLGLRGMLMAHAKMVEGAMAHPLLGPFVSAARRHVRREELWLEYRAGAEKAKT